MAFHLEIRELLANQFTEVYWAPTKHECELWLDQARILGKFLKEEICSVSSESESTFYSSKFATAISKDSELIAWDNDGVINYVFSLETRILPYQFVGPCWLHGKTSVFQLNPS